jgi:hypothetical protein
MKRYEWLTLVAALLITLCEVLMFNSQAARGSQKASQWCGTGRWQRHGHTPASCRNRLTLLGGGGRRYTKSRASPLTFPVLAASRQECRTS